MQRMKWMTALAVSMFAATAMANTVAITEFVNNTEGEDSGREFVEIFNYGPSSVDLSSWTLMDEDSDSYTFPGISIPSGGYMVLVAGGSGSDLTPAQAKAVFEQEWLGGVADSRVLGMSPFALGNGDDELILKDASNNTVWSLAFSDDETGEIGTFLTGDDFSTTAFGTKAAPGVVRNGFDNGSGSFLGYEENVNVTDTFAYDSDFAAIKDGTFLTGQGIATNFFDNVDAATHASPLLGGYTVVPEPSSIALLLMGGVAVLRRRK